MATDPTTDSSGDLVFDDMPFFRAYKDGRVERLVGTDVVPAGVDHATGVASKDVVIDPGTGVWVRLYLPPSLGADHPNTRLPVLVYFHGGGFIIESAASPTYHAYLNAVAARARVVAVSVDYRRAPEHPIPAAYDDSWVALRWVASHAGGANGAEPWLVEHGDLRRVFLAGDSAGANIAHNMAVRASGGVGVGVEGLVLAHPYFWLEGAGATAEERARTERMWRFIYPSASERVLEEACLNPAGEEGLAGMAGMAGRRVLVCLAERDFLREQGRRYCEVLRGSEFPGEVEVMELEGEGHVFHLLNPGCDRAVEMMDRMVAFLNK